MALILKNCLEIAEESTYEKIGVLVCASHKRYGGGYRNHSNAQEEYLFNNTLLRYATPPKGYYPLAHDEAKGFTVEAGLRSGKLCTFIFVPAPVWSVNPDVGNLQNRAMLIHELSKDIDHLILSAWGCGVFGCPPVEIVKALNKSFQSHTIPQVDMAFLDPKMMDNFRGVFCG
jgi:hypothetical protein